MSLRFYDPDYAYYPDPEDPDFTFVKVRSTGEICRTSSKIATKMFILASDCAKKERRSKPGKTKSIEAAEMENNIRFPLHYQHFPDLFDDEESFSHWVTAPVPTGDIAEGTVMTEAFLCTLSPQNRRVVQWILAGYSQSEIAAMEKVRPQSIHNRLKKIRARAKKFFQGG